MKMKTKAILSRWIVLCISLALVATPLTAFAAEGISLTDGSTQTHEGAITTNADKVDALTVTDKSTVTQNGDVTATGDGASGVKADNATVTVNGNVETAGRPYTEETTSDYYEASAVIAENAATVTVNGNVSATGKKDKANAYWSPTGVVSFDGSKVTVNGNVTTQNGAMGADVSEGTIAVNGNVTSRGDDAIALSAFSSSVGISDSSYDHALDNIGTIIVAGDAISDDIGVEMDRYSTILVDGTLKGNGTTLSIITWEDEQEKYPTIVVKNLEVGTDGNLIEVWRNYDISEKDSERDTAMENTVLNQIKYIIDADGFDVAGAQNITVDGKTYLVATEGTKLTLTPKVAAGSRLISTNFGSYTKKTNGDGTYTVTVARGGNLTFTAKTAAIARSNDTGKNKPQTYKQVATVNTAKLASNDSVASDLSTTGFRIKDSDFTKFQNVVVDGAVVDPDNYTVAEGSTVITFKKSYLATLSSGSHSIYFSFTDGRTPDAAFNVASNNNGEQQIQSIALPPEVTNTKTSNPTITNTGAAIKTGTNAGVQTGDDSQIALWAMIFTAACAGLAAVIYRKKRI